MVLDYLTSSGKQKPPKGGRSRRVRFMWYETQPAVSGFANGRKGSPAKEHGHLWKLNKAKKQIIP